MCFMIRDNFNILTNTLSAFMNTFQKTYLKLQNSISAGQTASILFIVLQYLFSSCVYSMHRRNSIRKVPFFSVSVFGCWNLFLPGHLIWFRCVSWSTFPPFIFLYKRALQILCILPDRLLHKTRVLLQQFWICVELGLET